MSTMAAELTALRNSLREFLDADRAEFGWPVRVDAWLSSWDEAFSARLGAAGFLGLTIPGEYGGHGIGHGIGHGLGHLHRYVVTEELLAAGAPVAAHWIADRQVGPALLSYGTEEQRRRILPDIAAGRFFSAIGMSEPQAGSDLAAATTKAIADWLSTRAGTYRKVQRERAAPPQDRITRSAWFVREHDEVPASTWQRADVRSPANCSACHRQADQGLYDEHDIRIPR